VILHLAFCLLFPAVGKGGLLAASNVIRVAFRIDEGVRAAAADLGEFRPHPIVASIRSQKDVAG
jgi:hypothetical protein